MATGPEAFARRMKEEKERAKEVKTKTAELHQNFRATEINQSDRKLQTLKQEERKKMQETAEMWRQFKRLEIGESERQLAVLKQEERRRLQETEHMLHTHQNNTIKESDMKLSVMRQEQRKRMQEHEAMLRQVNRHTPGFQKVSNEMRRTSSHDDLDAEMERKEERENAQNQQPPPRSKVFRRSSIGTVVSGNWRANTATTTTTRASWKQSTTTPAPPPPVKADAMDPIGNTSTHSIQSLKSIFSKVNAPPNNGPRPLYHGNDSMSGSLIADPIDEGSSTQVFLPESSEHVEPTTEQQQPALIDTKASTMKDAMSVFNKGNSNTEATSRLLPKRNADVSSSVKPMSTADNGTKPEQPKDRIGWHKVPSSSSSSLSPPLEPAVPAQDTKIPEDMQEPAPEEVVGDELLANPATVVRLDVLFSFGLLTSSDKPVFTNYMNAVEQIVKKTVLNNTAICEYVWYDPVYPPFVQDYKTDDSYKDPSGRGNVRRLLVIAAIPIFLSNGISVREAREGVCIGLQGAINSGEFIRLAKTSRSKASS